MNMKYAISTLLAFLIWGISYGQKSQMVATYNFINNDAQKAQTVKLWINSSSAYSEFFDIKSTRDTLFTDTYNENVHFTKENNDPVKEQYFLKKDSITFRDHIYTENKFIPVIVSEMMPQYNWKLENESTKIGSYTCSKATVNFRGRSYTAWYTTDVPTPFGPWKFYGLPGLIVKMESSDKSILFQLTKLSLTEKEDIKKPTSGKKITFKEFVSYEKKVADDFAEKLKTKLPRGATIKVNATESTHIEKKYD